MTIKSDYYGGGSATPLILQSGANTNQLYLATCGNVGIGTSTTYSTLTVGSGDGTAVISPGGTNTHLTLASLGAAGAIRFYTIGGGTGVLATTESMRVAVGGNVGIGRTDPTRLLDVSALGTAYIRASDRTNSVNVDMLAASSGGWIGTQTTHAFMIQTDNTERMRITSTGVACFSGAVCVPNLRVQSGFADLVLCGSNTTSPHIGGTFTITTNQDGNGRTIIGNAAVGRAMYLEAEGNFTFSCAATFSNAVSTGDMVTIGISDISTGENKGLRLNNTGGGGKAWNITAGRVGSNNNDFVVRNSTDHVNNLILDGATGAATFYSSVEVNGTLTNTNTDYTGRYTTPALSLTGGSAGGGGQTYTIGNSGMVGMLVVGIGTQAVAAIFLLNGGNPPIIVSQSTSETRFSITSGSLNTANVYLSGANLVLNNNIQATRTFYTTFIGKTS